MGSRAVATSQWADAPHVVIVPRSASGHFIPFLPFARRLATAGVVATIVTSDKKLLELRASLGTTDFTSLEGYPLRTVGLGDKTSLEVSHREWFLVDALKVAIELKGRSYTKEELESEEARIERFVTKEEIEKKARSLKRKAKLCERTLRN